jgi:hypothetical protein
LDETLSDALNENLFFSRKIGFSAPRGVEQASNSRQDGHLQFDPKRSNLRSYAHDQLRLEQVVSRNGWKTNVLSIFAPQNCSLPFSFRRLDIPALLKSWQKHYYLTKKNNFFENFVDIFFLNKKNTSPIAQEKKSTQISKTPKLLL